MIHKLLHDHPDVLSVILAHTAAIGITFTNVELTLKIISLLLAIGYTAWKWIREYKHGIKTKKNKVN